MHATPEGTYTARKMGIGLQIWPNGRNHPLQSTVGSQRLPPNRGSRLQRDFLINTEGVVMTTPPCNHSQTSASRRELRRRCGVLRVSRPRRNMGRATTSLYRREFTSCMQIK